MAYISLEVYGYNFLQAGGMADYIALVLAIDLYKRQKKIHYIDVMIYDNTSVIFLLIGVNEC